MNPDIIHALETAAIVVAGTLTGSELAVAVFFHPRISRLGDAVHIRACSGIGEGSRHGDVILVSAYISACSCINFRCALGTEHAVVAGTRLDGAFCPHKCLLRALARSHQQSGCPLAARFGASKLAGFAPPLGFASCHPGRLFGYRFDSSRCLMCLLNQSPNPSMKPTAPLRSDSSVLATTPCLGLSLSRKH
jgi:hypothetical protein